MKSKAPLYFQVQSGILEIIKSLEVGDKIPIETELMRKFDVSRVTIRKAIENLVLEGLLEKKPGIGTMVCRKSTSQKIGKVYSWTEVMKSKNLPTSSSNLEIQLIKGSSQLTKDLHLARNEKLVRISRIRMIEDKPIVIMVNYLREKFIPGFIERGLSQESLYNELENVYGILLSMGEEVITARNATPIEAALLKVEEGAALLHVRRRTFINNNTPFEIVDMVARGDKYEYFADLSGGYKTGAVT